MHENLNQQREKYLQDAFVKHRITIPSEQLASKYEYLGEQDQAFLSSSTFSLFRKQNSNFKPTNTTSNQNSISSTTDINNKNASESVRDSGTLVSASVMSMNTGVTSASTLSTLSTSKLSQSKNDTNYSYSSNKKNFKVLSEDISIGGKQMLEQQQNQYHPQIPLIANAKIEYPQKLKPLNLESINRIKKLLNLEDTFETQSQQHILQNHQQHQQQVQQYQAQLTKSSSNAASSSLANLKLKLRESRLRHSVKSDNNLTKSSSSIDNNALLIQTLRNIKKNEGLSSDSLKSNTKIRLPSITSVNTKTFKKEEAISSNQNIYNSNIQTIKKKKSKSSDDVAPLTVAGITYVPPNTPKIIITKTINESEHKNYRMNNHITEEKCIFCNNSEDFEAPTPDFKPLITIITTSKPSSNNNNQFYASPRNSNNNNAFLYRSYHSPAPSPEILI